MTPMSESVQPLVASIRPPADADIYSPAELAISMPVSSQQEYESAANMYKELGKQIRIIEEKRKKIKSGILESGRAVDLEAKEGKAPLEEAQAALYPRIDRWEQQEAARQTRLETDARALATSMANTLALEEATAAEEAGEPAIVVEAILSEPVLVPVRVPQTAYQRVPGVTRKAALKAVSVDVMKLAAWVCMNPRFAHYLQANTPALNDDIRKQQERFSADGVTVG
tara:strand:+ start:500 stop:1180 length:681 start_codon:yes stop_codon:yes gene_type:complete